jgi:pilus assembly protein CpaE
MAEIRIAARVADPEILNWIKGAAATHHARFLALKDIAGNDNHLGETNLVILEAVSREWVLRDLESSHAACPRASVLVVASGATTPDDMRAFFRAGAVDVIAAPATQDKIAASIGENIGAQATGESRATVIAFVRAAGGVGATTLAANLAGHFVNPRGKRGDQLEPLDVALLDFDLQFGDAALALDMNPRGDITDILRSPKRLDAHFLGGVLERHKSGVNLLAAPQKVVPLEAINADVALSIVNVAASFHDIVVLELPAAWTDWTGALLRRADHLVLVSSAAVRGVAGARRVLDAAAEMNVEAGRWSLVFNRLSSVLDGNDIIDQARRALGPPVIATITEDPAVRVAADRGRLIWETAPNSRFAKDLRPFATEVSRMLEHKRYPSTSREMVR